MKLIFKYVCQLVFILLIGCEYNGKTLLTKVTFEVFKNDSVQLLKIKLENLNDYGIYSPYLGSSSISFFNERGEEIFDDKFPIYEPIWLTSIGKKECMDTLINPWIICWEYDSLLKYQNTESGQLIYKACQRDYELFLSDNNMDSINDSIFIKEMLLFEYSGSRFIKPQSSIHWCYNIKNILQREEHVKVLFQFEPQEKESYKYFLSAEYDSLEFRSSRPEEINGFYLLKTEITSDTFLIK
jgi:hypothetical protein